MLIVLFIISVFGGFLSGFIGLGGALVIIPLILTIPPLLNQGSLEMKVVTVLSMIQVLFSSFSGIIIHRKNNMVHNETLLSIGIPLGIFSLLGAYFSKFLKNQYILIIFSFIIFLSFLLLLFDPENEEGVDPKTIKTNKKLSIIIGILTGTISGIVGAGGGFILIPIMMKVFKFPLKLTIGTSLGIVFIGALFGSIGKIYSVSFDYMLLFPIITGSVLSAQIGAQLNKITPPKILKGILLIAILASFIQMLIKIIE